MALGWAARNLSSGVGFGASLPLSATARRKARKSSPLATAKPLKALETMSVLPPPGRWKRTAIPCGLAPAARSGTSGRPVLSENRTVALTGPPRRCGAFDRPGAVAEGTNSPSQTTPLAWADRKPGCLPKIAFIASTICSGRPSGSSALAPRPSSVAAAIAFRMSRLPNALVISIPPFVVLEARRAGSEPRSRIGIFDPGDPHVSALIAFTASAVDRTAFARKP